MSERDAVLEGERRVAQRRAAAAQSPLSRKQAVRTVLVALDLSSSESEQGASLGAKTRRGAEEVHPRKKETAPKANGKADERAQG